MTDNNFPGWSSPGLQSSPLLKGVGFPPPSGAAAWPALDPWADLGGAPWVLSTVPGSGALGGDGGGSIGSSTARGEGRAGREGLTVRGRAARHLPLSRWEAAH